MSGGVLYFAFCAVVCGFGSLYGWWRHLTADNDREFVLWLVVGLGYGVLAAISVNLAVTWSGG